MAWPCREELWTNLEATCGAYRDVAHAIRRFEPVTMVTRPEQVDSARSVLGTDIDILEIPIDDSWTRDTGPNFVIDDSRELSGVCFTFNAWGQKYPGYEEDARLGRRILDHIGLAAIESPLVAEGGGLFVDGEGTLLTTDTCFPNANRNPDWSRDQIEDELKRLLGVEKVLWLPGDPLDRETDGHVDGLATFARPGMVIIESAGEESRKPYFRQLREAVESMTDARGRQLELLEIPEADGALATSDRYCLSYVNFYIVNGAVIAPAYGAPSDDLARERLQSCFPDREVVMVPIAAIAEGGGGIHCITQQQPAV
jgi:agmatine deiminase